MTARPAFASEVDAFAFGPAPSRSALGAPPLFAGRIGDPAHPPQVGRYHLYGGWSCPRTHRATIALELAGLSDAVSVSYVDGLRDGRGWAFRARTGADPVNGFGLMSEVYAASRNDATSYASIPVLWDRQRARIVSNVADDIDRDMSSAFVPTVRTVPPAVELYPSAFRAEIDALSAGNETLWRTMSRAAYADTERSSLRRRLRELDERLAAERYLVGGRLTLADVRLWVLLIRYDAGINAHGAAGTSLDDLPALHEYAHRLHALTAFRTTTRVRAFGAPLSAAAERWAGRRRGDVPLRRLSGGAGVPGG